MGRRPRPALAPALLPLAERSSSWRCGGSGAWPPPRRRGARAPRPGAAAGAGAQPASALLPSRLLVLIALARPQWGFRWQQVRRRGLDILVVLDTSNSMRADRPAAEPAGAAKRGVRDLLARLKGDRIGLVAFAGASFLACPLTTDHGPSA